MAVVGAVQALFTSDTTDWSKGCKQATKELQDTEQKTKRSFKDIRSDINKTWGKKGDLAQTLKMIKGGGAIAGLSMLGNSLAHWTGDIAEIAKGMATGEKHAGDMVVGITKGLPVIGGFATATENILGLMTGTTQAIAKNNQQMEETTKIMESQIALSKLFHAEMDAIHKDTSRVQRNIVKASADPLALARLTAQQNVEDLHNQNAEKLKADLAAIDAAAKPEIDTLRDQSKHGDNNAKDILKIRMGKIEKEKSELRTGYANLEKLQVQQNAAELAEAEKKVFESNSKAKIASYQSAYNAEAEARISALKLAGHSEQAEAQAIAEKLKQTQEANIQAAKDKVKELGLNENTGLGKDIMNNAQKANAALLTGAKNGVAKIQADKNKELTEGAGSEVSHFNDQLKEYKRLLNDGVITLEVYQKARAKAMKDFQESILPQSAEQSAVSNYKKKVEELGEALKSKLISQDQFKNGVAQLQSDLQKSVTPQFQESQQQVRRFNFGRLNHPDMSSPIRGLVKVTEDSAATQKAIEKAIMETNKILEKNLKPTPISLK